MLKHVVSLSGGKDSTAMLLKMLEHDMQIDRVVCVDTTKEFPEMYEHLKKLQTYISPLKIEILTLDYDYWFSKHLKYRGKNKGQIGGYGWPDFRNRWCTARKTDVFKRHVYKDQNSIIEYHGIAADEPHRVNNNVGRDIKYPLVDWEITEKDALAYCYSKGFDWGGLYQKFSRVSCWCCPLSRIGELKTLHDDFPNLWKKLQEMDKLSFRKFRSDYTVEQLTQKFTQV